MAAPMAEVGAAQSAPLRVVHVSRVPVLPGAATLVRGARPAAPLVRTEEAAREVERPVGPGELSARLNEERGLWSSCLDEKIGHLADLVGALEQRLESGLQRLGASMLPSHAGCEEELPVESAAQRLPSELSVLSQGHEETSSVSTGAPLRARQPQEGKLGHLSVLDTMCRAVEALQDQSRIHRGEIKSLQVQQAEQSGVSRELACGLEGVKEDLRLLLGGPGQPNADVEELRSQIFRNCGDIAALRSHVVGNAEAPVFSPGRPRGGAGATPDAEALEAQLEALRAQVSAIGLQQGALQMQTGHTAAIQQQVVSHLGETKGQLIYSIANLQDEVRRQGGHIGALLQASDKRSCSPQGRALCGVTASAQLEEEAAVEEDEQREELEAGCIVTVLEDFASNSKGSVLLREGWEGEVIRLDQDGDAYIKFQTQGCKEWVIRRNFPKLRVSHAVEETEAADSSEDEEATSRLRGVEASEATEMEPEDLCSCKLF